MSRVELTWHEVTLAAHVGVMRSVGSLEKKLVHKGGFGDGAAWNNDILGALGEMAFCKWAGVFWEPRIGTYKKLADVGDNIEIRTRSKDWHELNVRPDDKDILHRVFVLVTGKPPFFTVRGWMVGHDCTREEWWINPDKREYAWFVPQKQLRPLTELEQWLAPIRKLRIRIGGNDPVPVIAAISNILR